MAELVEYLVGDSRIVEDLMTIRLPVLSKKRFNIINKWQPFRMLAKIIPLNIHSVARAKGAWLVAVVAVEFELRDQKLQICSYGNMYGCPSNIYACTDRRQQRSTLSLSQRASFKLQAF